MSEKLSMIAPLLSVSVAGALGASVMVPLFLIVTPSMVGLDAES